ncbi:MAG: hypothetical protein MHM6MM_001865 [Cercozoa sp. M6MM]
MKFLLTALCALQLCAASYAHGSAKNVYPGGNTNIYPKKGDSYSSGYPSGHSTDYSSGGYSSGYDSGYDSGYGSGHDSKHGKNLDHFKQDLHSIVMGMDSAGSQLQATIHQLWARLKNAAAVIKNQTQTTTTTTTTATPSAAPTETTTTAAATTQTTTLPCDCTQEDVPVTPVPTPCPSVPANPFLPGDPCTCDFECASGADARCSGDCTVTLLNGTSSAPTDAGGAPLMHVCISASQVPAGQACHCDSQCPSGLQCVGADLDAATSRTCALTLGQSCDFSNDMCMPGLQCDASSLKCVIPLGTGTPIMCRDRADCPDGALCDDSGDCKGARDQACTENGECLSGTCTSNMCEKPTGGALGDLCDKEIHRAGPNDDGTCSDGDHACANTVWCFLGYQEVPPNPNGTLRCLLRSNNDCNTSSECVSGQCNLANGRCAETPYSQRLRLALLAPGSECGFPMWTCFGGVACASGLCDFGAPGETCNLPGTPFECEIPTSAGVSDFQICTPAGMCPFP